ncbi:MAG: hypothetical protein ACOH2P_05510 [Pseudomonas sp.]
MQDESMTLEQPGIRETSNSDLYLSKVEKSVGVLIPPYDNMAKEHLIKVNLEFLSDSETITYERPVTEQEVGKTITVEFFKEIFEKRVDQSVRISYEVRIYNDPLGKSAYRGLHINP